MSEITLRRAGLEDAARLAALGAAAFAETFADLYPPDDLTAFLVETYSAARFAEQLADAGQAVWIAETGGLAIGYVQAGPCRLPHPDASLADGEVKRLYVRASHQRAGVGGRLLAAALAWLKPRPRVWIGVWSENHGAQRLYARHGFVKVGEYEFPVGRTRDLEFILRRG